MHHTIFAESKFKKLSQFWWLLLLLYSCKTPDYQDKGIEGIIHLPIAKNAIAVVIIPGQGCEGCITYAEDFVRSNVARFPNVVYVFTKIQSKKILKIKLGKDVINSPNIKLDTLNVIECLDEVNCKYPAIYYLKDARIVSMEYQNPTNPGFINLKTYIENTSRKTP